MPSFVYYGVQNLGGRKIVSSVHHTWGIPGYQSSNPELRVAGQAWDPHKSALPNGVALSPEERMLADATRCSAHEVWRQQLKAGPASGYPDAGSGGLVAFDSLAPSAAAGRAQVITEAMLADVVGVSSLLPPGAAVVAWGLNGAPTVKPATPWAG